MAIFLGLLLLTGQPLIAHSQPVDKCRIDGTKYSALSLGFPVKTERLNHLAKPRILVLPYQAKDEPDFKLDPIQKDIFAQSAEDIRRLSSNQSNVEFIFHPTIKLSLTTAEVNDLKINDGKTYLKDFEKSQFGSVAKIIQDYDSTIDYTNIDGVVLIGASQTTQIEIASALQYTKDPEFIGNETKRPDGKPWFSPIVTNEKEIANVVLMYNRFNSNVLTHELMHNYGLTDLYGRKATPPISIMGSTTQSSLLPFEKWVLGWLPNSNVTCVDPNLELSQDPAKNRFVLDYSKGDHSMVIPTGSNTALIVDVANSNDGISLVHYSLNNDSRPPLEIFPPSAKGDGSLFLTDLAGVSAQLKSPNYTLLVSENNGTSVTVNLIPNNAIDSKESVDLINASLLKKEENLQLIKRKQEAEAQKKAERESEKNLSDAQSAGKSSAKKSTITCTKGKLVKKISGPKAKCPKGYVKK